MCDGGKTEEVVPGPTAAEDKLPEEDKARGVVVMDKQWGYRAVIEPDGYVMPFDFDIGACQALRKQFDLNSHDVVVCTYPKCGTAWMQQIVLLLLRGSDATVTPMSDAMWLEMSASSAANGMDSSSPAMSVDDMCKLPPPPAEEGGKRVWKTHGPAKFVPWKGGTDAVAAAGAKVVLVSRNPKDTAISMLHHTKAIPPFGFDGKWEEFAPLFLDGKVEHGSFWDWHRDWRNAGDQMGDSLCWVAFEDLKKDLRKEIGRISVFLGLERSEEELDKVTERCTFTAMKDESAKRGDRASKKGHFRSGKVGGWKDVMAEETVAAFDEKTKKLYEDCTLRFE